MIVKTSRFGDKEVPDEALLIFPEGVIGFKDATRFVMFECSDDGIFKWLQSCDRPELAFVICEASLIVPTYNIIIGDKERQVLKLERPEDAAVCLILVIPKNPVDATANLLGPLVMNTETRLGLQVVVVNPQYSTRYRLFKDTSQSGPPAAETVGKEEPGHAGA
ncbi:MAG: flagellar assembly protein FliW [Planctomycetota bacterium]|jgi:flagellar assembly factor FliW|nr:flagellar assembly protein FliW [Planctomycetota bacterium]